jgi:hypothetical protein
VRRSIDSGSAIPAGLQSGRKLESLHRRFGNPHPDAISSDTLDIGESSSLGQPQKIKSARFCKALESSLQREV